MKWDSPAPTITTQCYNYGSGRFGHPVQDRAISLREAALLQGFPVNYQFESADMRMTTRELSRLIGNAVPPPLGVAIATALRDCR
jgi:DNA (cytosine-5)-methyltransferase 1